ncbi:MAG: 3-alpha domain-containing protein [Candidatus Udaeobacter sp.]
MVAPDSTLRFSEEGEVAAGDSIEVLERDEHNVTVADVVNLYRENAGNEDLLRRVSELPSLPNSWRDYFRRRLLIPTKNDGQ